MTENSDMAAANLRYRPAEAKDRDLLFRWVNDPEVRRNAFDPHLISYEEHVSWFEKVLASSDCFLFICCLGNRPAGQLRIAVENGEGVVSYSVASEFRGRGIGTAILADAARLAMERIPGVRRLTGRVKPDNTASRKAFLSAGFCVCSEKEDSVEYCKRVEAG